MRVLKKYLQPNFGYLLFPISIQRVTSGWKKLEGNLCEDSDQTLYLLFMIKI